MRTAFKLLLGFAVIAALGWLLRATVLAPVPVKVRVVRVARGRVEATVANSKAGTVKARRRAHLAPEASGRVTAVGYHKGDTVEAGAILVRLDDASQRAQLGLANGALATSRAQRNQACIAADRAGRDLERNRGLARDRLVSPSLLDQLGSAHEAAAAACTAGGAEIERAQAGVAAAEAELAKTVLRAPFAGTVAELQVEVGEWVSPSPPLLPVPPVVDLIDLGSIYLSAPMDEVDSGLIHVGQEVRATVDALPGRKLAARVSRVAAYVRDIEQQNRTVEIEVELADRGLAATLLPGTSADVEVIREARDHVLRLPSPTLLEGKRVLVIEGGWLIEREVKIGLRNWDFAEILGPLREGDAVVSTLDRAEVKAGNRAVIEGEGPGS